MGLIKTSLASGGGYSLIKAASKAATEHEEQKQKQRENLQPASQRLRHASQQQYYLNNKRRMGYKDGSQMNNPHTQPSYPLHGPKSKLQVQSQSTHQPSMCCTSTRTMENPPPYDPSPQTQSQSTHHPSMCTRAIEDPPPYDQSHPYEMQVDGYTPFAQGDTLSTGTGLGLSIVRGIVETLDGNINIQSRLGEGTTVKVSFPLERPMEEESVSSTLQVKNSQQKTHTTSSQLRHVNLTGTGKRVAIWGIDPSCIGEYQFWSSIFGYTTDQYGLQLVSWSAEEHIDVLLVDESDICAEELQHLPTALPGLLIVRNNTGNTTATRMQWSHLADCLAILHRPCGPQKLARGILSCLSLKPASSTSHPPSPGQTFVAPERPRSAGLGSAGLASSIRKSTPSSSRDLEPSAPESSIPVASSPICVSDFTEHDVSVSGLGTEISGRVMSGNTASDFHCPSSTSSTSSRPLANALSGSQGRPRVLLVDDNDINLRLMMTFMKKRKIMVLDTAENGRVTVDFVKRMLPAYDLIFMDMSMPMVDGFEATRAIRAIEKDRDGCVPAKIIAFTGLSSLRDETKALNSGVDLFLTKSVSFEEISRLINEWETDLSK